MKHRKTVFAFMALFCAAALFLGCPTDPEDEQPNYGGDAKSLPAVSLAAADGTKYYSLSTGLEVTGDDIKTNKWDIAFSRTRIIYTNSGATAVAEESGGLGGVWHTDKIVLADVTDGDAIKDDPVYGDYNTDVIRYVGGMGEPAPNRLNVMTFVGYPEGEGTVETPFTAGTSGYLYDKKQYYTSSGMGGSGPTFGPTNQVYIIRHGDGEHYSKIQIGYEYIGAGTGENASPAKDAWLVRYQNF